ncbi:echinoderm microtubule-associated protein-like 1 isoform X1 [Nerophis ophidion]|uniref:echinoderm microtubule-associated protein-like 1 isoform X1 n=1 Tax=Nerophis ophidion TaxID=159077 RepID=UPI002ADF0A4C|nr:echinoderm microtubule-associated protein-like 1 isoform X1 [Nerophis ophidion]
MIATLPLRPSVNNGTIVPKKSGGTLPSPSGSGSRKDTSAPSSRSLSPLSLPTRILSPLLSTVRRANSNEHVGSLTRKDSGDSKGNRTRAGSTGSNSSGKRSDSKQRDPVFNAGKSCSHVTLTSHMSMEFLMKQNVLLLGNSFLRHPLSFTLPSTLHSSLHFHS